MKITRQQLRKLIIEQAKDVIVVSDEDKRKAAELKKSIKDKNDEDDQEIDSLPLKSLAESKKEFKEIHFKKVDRAIISCLKKEGGAAGMGMLIDAVKSLETKTKKLPDKLSSKSKIKKYISNHAAVLTHKYKDIILIKGLPKSAIKEALEKVGFYKKYSYGLDDVPDKTKAHDDIIGHT